MASTSTPPSSPEIQNLSKHPPTGPTPSHSLPLEWPLTTKPRSYPSHRRVGPTSRPHQKVTVRVHYLVRAAPDPDPEPTGFPVRASRAAPDLTQLQNSPLPPFYFASISHLRKFIFFLLLFTPLPLSLSLSSSPPIQT